MENLDDAITNICRLKGEIMALRALLTSILDTRPPDDLKRIRRSFEENIELALVTTQNALIGEHVVSQLEEEGNVIRELLSRQDR